MAMLYPKQPDVAAVGGGRFSFILASRAVKPPSAPILPSDGNRTVTRS